MAVPATKGRPFLQGLAMALEAHGKLAGREGIVDYAVVRTPDDRVGLTQIPGKGRRKVLELSVFGAKMVGQELGAQAPQGRRFEDYLGWGCQERDGPAASPSGCLTQREPSRRPMRGRRDA